MKIELGSVAKDKITGFKGVVMGRTEYLTGCIQYGLQNQKLIGGQIAEWKWFDEQRLIVVQKNAFALKAQGGNQPSAPSVN